MFSAFEAEAPGIGLKLPGEEILASACDIALARTMVKAHIAKKISAIRHGADCLTLQVSIT